MNVLEELEKSNIPEDVSIYKAFLVANAKLETYDKIVCSVSGGSDSDVMLDLLERINKDIGSKITYVYFDTGLEYKATKEHLKELENKYEIKIQRIRAKKPIPLSCKEYGQPFLSKQVSENIYRLQKHDFKWEDKTFEELYEEYPKCKTALKWWCNSYPSTKSKKESRFNINRHVGLKEFMILNPPTFKISQRCCNGAKKDPIHHFLKNNNYQLNVYGVRKAEGGQRATTYKNCFTPKDEGPNEYRPIFWIDNNAKALYVKFFGIEHSKCYTEYGLKRTGCAGCPYGRNFEQELKILKKHEPSLYNAVTHIFKESYDYTRAYKAFRSSWEYEFLYG